MHLSPDHLDETKIQTLKCENCSDWLRLIFGDYENVVEGIKVSASGLPILECPGCGTHYLPNRSKGAVLYHVRRAHEGNSTAIRFSRRPQTRSRPSSAAVQFEYDTADYEYLPGLIRPWDDGFLTPVFFNKSVLLKFMHHPDYAVELGSDTYGSVYKKGHDSFEFGINRNGKVIAWLGDIEKLDLEDQHYLRSENVPSDHDIGSEFYLGQIEAVFTGASQEHILFQLRMTLAQKWLEQYHLRLNQYELEIIALVRGVVRPVVWSEKEVRAVIESLNKILVESINASALREAIKARTPAEDLSKLGGLKLLQKWIEIAYAHLDAAKVMCPFFVLYDFRIVAAHLVPDARAGQIRESCYDRLGLTGHNRSVEGLYDTLIKALGDSHKLLIG